MEENILARHNERSPFSWMSLCTLFAFFFHLIKSLHCWIRGAIEAHAYTMVILLRSAIQSGVVLWFVILLMVQSNLRLTKLIFPRRLVVTCYATLLFSAETDFQLEGEHSSCRPRLNWTWALLAYTPCRPKLCASATMEQRMIADEKLKRLKKPKNDGKLLPKMGRHCQQKSRNFNVR